MHINAQTDGRSDFTTFSLFTLTSALATIVTSFKQWVYVCATEDRDLRFDFSAANTGGCAALLSSTLPSLHNRSHVRIQIRVVF